ncbi:MAG: vitamin K epoxide reductase family protein [Tepidiformaceae bacterium]
MERPLRSDAAAAGNSAAEEPAGPGSAGTGAAPLPFQRLQKVLTVAAACLAVGGVGIASYLAVENLQGNSGVCTVVHGCQTVQQSAYGKVLGVPVSVPGLAMYVFLLLAALVVLTNARELRPTAAFLAFNGALFGFCFSIYLTYIEGWVLDAWCIYCIGSATLMTLSMLCWGSILSIEVKRRRQERGGETG